MMMKFLFLLFIDGGFLEEEIFAIDGDMEEFIAYDCGR